MRKLQVLCCAAALVALTVPSAHADEWNKKTFLTFSGPVQIPGTTLPAGTYMFKLADLESNRHVVQIFEKEGGKLLATFLTVPDYKLDVPDKNVVMFGERPKGMPQAIKAWWYPGDPSGDEFVYPKSQAVIIARDTHEAVLSTADDSGTTADTMKGAKVGRVNENGEMADNTAPSAKANTAASSGTTAAAPPAQPPATTATTATTGTTAATGTTARTGATTGTTARANTAAIGTSGHAAPAKSRKRLPATGSELPLIELLSIAAFAGFLGTRQLRRRFADRA
jgi:hypothetical protein